MYKEDKITDTIRNIINSILPDSRIVLFGSRARIDHTEHSDYDILIITNKVISNKEKFPIKTQIRKSLLKIGIFSDILIQSDQEIEVKKKLPGHIVKTIIKEGIPL